MAPTSDTASADVRAIAYIHLPVAAANITANVPRDVVGRAALKRENTIETGAVIKPLPDFCPGILGETVAAQDGVQVKPSIQRSELVGSNEINSAVELAGKTQNEPVKYAMDELLTRLSRCDWETASPRIVRRARGECEENIRFP